MSKPTLSDLFHRINKVLPEEQDLITCSPDDLVEEILCKMIKDDLSQVPVVIGKNVLGVFSYRSFVIEVMNLLKTKERDILGLPVEPFMDELHFARITDEINKLFNEFNFNDAVLIGNQSKLQGIVTTIDALRYFYKIASPYVLISEIELAIRELLSNALTENEISNFAKNNFQHYKKENEKFPLALIEMTLKDYVTIIRFKGHWESKLKIVFGGSYYNAITKLAKLPDLRNDIFHFNREPTMEDIEILRGARDWLLKNITKIEFGKKNNG